MFRLNFTATLCSRLCSQVKFVQPQGQSVIRQSVTGTSTPMILSRRQLSSREKRKITDISGIYPPIATPFHDNGDLALDKLEHNVNLWNQIPLRGLAVLGSNGEVAYLRPEEKVTMVSHVAKHLSPDKLIIGGAGCESTRDTVEMSKMMGEAGADLVLIVTPCYYKGRMTNMAFEKHYTRIADESPVPVILYSVPGNTGIDLSPDVIVKLAGHPNIIGVKDSGGDIVKISSLVHRTQGQHFQVLAGSAGFLLPALVAGCVGGICASANMLGQAVCNLEKLYKEGKIEEARGLQQKLIAPNSAVTKEFGVPALKKAMDWFGFYGGPPRSPMISLSTEEENKVRQSFIEGGFLK